MPAVRSSLTLNKLVETVPETFSLVSLFTLRCASCGDKEPEYF